MRKDKQDTAEQERDFQRHLRHLGLDSAEQYKEWCVEHGFSKTLYKTGDQRHRECSVARQVRAKQVLRSKKKRSGNVLETLTGICEGRLDLENIDPPHLARLAFALKNPRNRKLYQRRADRQSLLRLIEHLYRVRAKFFDDSGPVLNGAYPRCVTYLEALAMLARYASHWLRPVEDWKPSTHNAQRQFASLARHLLSKYDDVPRFFDSVWFGEDDKVANQHRYWYIRVARGENIRRCDLPIDYTKKMAHHFHRAPHDASIIQALRWGQVHGLGGDEPLARALFGTRLGESFDNEAFWITAIRWLIEHPMLDRQHVGPIVDYLQNQRFEPQPLDMVPGEPPARAAPQPNLTMRGRTPDALLRQVDQWHGLLRQVQACQVRRWQPSGIREFEFVEGAEHGNRKTWTIRELIGSRALVDEGRRMKHCVASYVSSCAQGRCSIWAMEVESREGRQKSLTLEIRNRTLCQARGKLNRLPTDKERQIFTRWTAEAGLRVASFV